MSYGFRLFVAATALVWLGSAALARALEGDFRAHDPSTIVQCDGRYYCFSTGRGVRVISSADRVTWRREQSVFQQLPQAVATLVPRNNGMDAWAPDVALLNGEYYLYYSVSSWGSEVSAIGLATSPTLNSADSKYHWTDRGMVVHSSRGERRNDIDPCIFQAPDHTLWLSYGSYIGVVELVQLDPATGLRITPDSRIYRLSADSEASAIIYRDKHYYLFVNRGSCCVGQHSTYHIQVGRSEQVTGPYRDRDGVDMLEGGGAAFMASSGKKIGPGHFGLLSENGVDRFSYHLEYDGDHPGRSVLDIRPLLFGADGWPKPGAEAVDGTYQLVCKGTGDVAQGGGGATKDRDDLRLGHHSGADDQNWTLTSVGVNQFRIIGSRSGKAMEVAGASRESGAHIDAGSYTAAENQIWRIEQLSDGTYRILSVKSGLALSGPAKESTPDTPLRQTPFKGDDNQKWLLNAP